MATIKLSEYLPQEIPLGIDSVETDFIQDEAVTKAKLEIDVQSSLDKADSAIQSDENYTTTEKNKLAGIATGATNNTGSLADKNSVGTGEIDNNAVTNVKLAQVATGRIKGRTSAGVGGVEDLTPAQARDVIGVNNFYPQAIVKHGLELFPNGSYYKLASLNGHLVTGGASISWLFTQVGDYGQKRRANFIISAIQRGSNTLYLTATSLDNLPIHTGVPRMQFGYVQTGEFRFDVYLKQVSYWDTMYVYELARDSTAGRVTTNYPLTRTSTEPSDAVWTLDVADISQIVMPTNSKNILQTVGDSQYIAMSQKAVTDALDSKVDKVQVKEILTANKTLTQADSGKLLIINADGITITMPASSEFNVDIAKMDENFTTIVDCAGTDKFREDTATISVIRDVSITNSGIAGKEWLAIGAYEV